MQLLEIMKPSEKSHELIHKNAERLVLPCFLKYYML